MKKDNNIETKKAELMAKLAENEGLKSDLQRTRADFENYRKNTENRIASAQKTGEMKAVLSLLPTLDDIERAISHLPADLSDNAWAQNVVKMSKNLDKGMAKIGVQKIDSKSGVIFNPEVHEAIQFDEESEGDNEVIDQELRAGYEMNGDVLRPAMVKVTRR